MAFGSPNDVSTIDAVGIGFGPSNLALAIALQELGEHHSIRFFERQAAFGWHRGMLIDGTTMQVSFLKDLVTMRNPASPYSFLAHLQAKGRLADFVNSKMFYPLRVEYHGYLEWAAGHFEEQVEYDARVIEVRPVTDNGVTEQLDVVAERAGGERLVQRTRNVVLAPGLSPVVPPDVSLSDRVWHSSELLDRLGRPTFPAPRRFVVVGAGQSAAEVAEHLHDRYRDAEVHAVLSRYGYSVADDSPFTNRIFDPAAVDHFYAAPPDVKRMLSGYHANTNYSVVDLELIQDLYRRVYLEAVTGRRRLHIHNVSRVDAITENRDSVEVRIRFLPSDEVVAIQADAIVFATGYRPTDPVALIGDVVKLCVTDDEGRLVTDRNYRVRTDDSVRCGIYLQGATEHSHGLTSSLLSTTAVRAGEIARAMTGRGPLAQP
jgi:L-ornithine N5-oxygenase